MRLGFHYHEPAALQDGRIRTSGPQGRFLDSLARHCERVVCFLHTPRADEEELLDYTLASQNVELVPIGPHASVPRRLALAWMHTARVRQWRSRLDAILIRGPSPLLPAVARAAAGVPAALLIVGDCLAGVDDLRQPRWRKEAIRLWWRWNDAGQRRLAKESLTFVNSRALFDGLQTAAPRLVELRTTTIGEEDLFLRADTCSAPPYRLLYVGRVDAGKGVADLLGAVALLVRSGVEVLLDVVGRSEPEGYANSLLDAALCGRLLGARSSLGSVRGSYESFRSSPLLMRYALSMADAVVVNSQTAGDQLASTLGPVGKRVFIVPNGVEDHVEARARARAVLAARCAIPEAGTWIGSVGRLVKGKGFELLLQSMRLLRASAPAARLILIGYGPGHSELSATVRELGLGEAVTFAGPVPDARRWLSAFDVFCFASTSEGMPNAVMEAAVAGVPIVAWRTPAVMELLADGVSGRLVTPGDVPAMSAAVRSLIENPTCAAVLGAAARRVMLTEFSVSRFVARMTEAYDASIGSRCTDAYVGAP